MLSGKYFLPFHEYPEVKNSDFAIILLAKKGMRPKVPENCPPCFKNLIASCWNEEFSKRPSINQILAIIARMQGNFQKNSFMWDNYDPKDPKLEFQIDVTDILTNSSSDVHSSSNSTPNPNSQNLPNDSQKESTAPPHLTNINVEDGPPTPPPNGLIFLLNKKKSENFEKVEKVEKVEKKEKKKKKSKKEKSSDEGSQNELSPLHKAKSSERSATSDKLEDHNSRKLSLPTELDRDTLSLLNQKYGSNNSPPSPPRLPSRPPPTKKQPPPLPTKAPPKKSTRTEETKN